MLEQIEAVAAELTAEPPGAVVVWGGPRLFSAGADIAEFGGQSEAAAISRQFRAALDRLAAIPRATIAAVAGYALGGGCELALACDLRVAADTARFGQPEILLGLIPGAGGTQRLTRLIGPSRAKDLVMTGRQVDAEEALRIGLADRVVPADALFDRAVELAASLAAGAVVAQGLAKQAIDEGLDRSLAACSRPGAGPLRGRVRDRGRRDRGGVVSGRGARTRPLHRTLSKPAGARDPAARPPAPSRPAGPLRRTAHGLCQAHATQFISAKVTRSGRDGTTRTAMP